ncbi:hypothetical protein B4U80_10254 [Leptotrombidium deliense]|nr:hypothetical protein B4U80_10254 [Leptotrombidium deliense]
MEAIGK